MSDQRRVIYCLVPPTAQELVEPLRAHYAHDPRVEVMLDRRVDDRRAPRPDDPPTGEFGRRQAADRRRGVLPRSVAPMPPELTDRSDEIRWVQRLLPVSGGLEELDGDEVVARLRAGDAEAPSELYWRYYERVYSRLCVVLGTPQRADEAIGAAFGRVLDALEDPANAQRPFDELLYLQIDALQSRPGPDGDHEPDGEVESANGGAGGVAKTGLRIVGEELDEPVVVMERNPQWASHARSERDRLMRKLPPTVREIEHVGGTAIPRVAARPIIDLLVGVVKWPPPGQLREALEAAGYEFCGSAGALARAYYRKRAVMSRFDVHVVEHGGPLWTGAVGLRDYLMRHPSDALGWANAKRRAARAAPDSLIRYAEARQHELEELLAKAAAAPPRH